MATYSDRGTMYGLQDGAVSLLGCIPRVSGLCSNSEILARTSHCITRKNDYMGSMKDFRPRNK